MKQSETTAARGLIARSFRLVEDIAYLGLALLLTSCAFFLLITGGMQFVSEAIAGTLSDNIVELLDQILLILLIVELLSTVQVSFREHAIVPGPFLLVGLIAAVRRVLILSAEFGEGKNRGDSEIEWFLIELGVFAVLIVAFVVCIRVLNSGKVAADPEQR
jgi:uncharacterized membrane protein (DUF373 family)